MKIIAINGSPRKGWNSAKLLEKWKEGVLSVIPDAEVQEVNLYDLDYKGCRSCFACKIKGGKFYGTCPIPDGAHDLIAAIKEADLVGIASPIYYCDLDAYTKCLLERVLFSVGQYSNPIKSLAPKAVSFTFLYAMNATKEQAIQSGIEDNCRFTENAVSMFYFMPPHHVSAYNTYQFTDYNRYVSDFFSEEVKREQRDKQFPKDLQAAFDEGAKAAKEVMMGIRADMAIDHTM